MGAMTTDDLLALVDSWIDPNPPVVLKQHERFVVARDDLLQVGTKARSLDFLVRTCAADEIVFGSCPATGYAQITLPFVCGRHGKRAVLFMAKRDPLKYTELQKRAVSFAAKGWATINWVPDGMLTVTQARAREYAARDPARRLVLPLGLEHPTVIASMIKVARALPIEPSEFWTAGSSGTLNRALQLAWPNAAANVVSVGHVMSDRERGRARLWRSELPFNRPVAQRDRPPFPSPATYDAKAWSFVRTHARDGALFWNVGA